MADSDTSSVMHKIMYLLVSVQKLRAGEGISPQLLGQDLDKHGISAADQKAGLELAYSKGWLQQGPEGKIQLTEKGFRVDLAQ